MIGDMGGGGLVLAWGIACALLEVKHSGKGQVIDASMCEGAALLAHGLYNLNSLGEWQGSCVLDSSAPFYDVYECADGQWISVCPLEPQFYSTFLERLSLNKDPDFSGQQYDKSLWPVMKSRLVTLFMSQPQDHWIALFNDSDDCVWPVLSMDDAPAHPHNLARNSFVEIAGVVQPAPTPKLSLTPGSVQCPPPLLGEHTYQELLAVGLTLEEIGCLVENGTVVAQR
jgi:alpha-methylacyl-CoA racemase